MIYQRPPIKDARAGGVGGLVFLCLFSLPFAGAGVFIVSKGVEALAQGKIKQGLGLSAFGLFFGAIGFGLMVGAIFGIRAMERAGALRIAHPEEPWLWRKDWAEGQINSSTKGAMWFAWGFAGFWNFISSGVVIALVTSNGRRDAGIYIALVFPLIGIGLLVWAIRQTIQWKKFGLSTFKMLSVPGVVGGRLSGAIESSVKIRPEDGFHLKLVCVNCIRTGSGKGSSTSENILWQDEKTMARELLDDDPRRSGIPVSFQIPPGAQESDNRDPNNRIIWRLEARAKVPGVGYAAMFEVPVFRTAASAAVAAPDADPVLAYEAPEEPYKLPAHSRIKLKELRDGGMEFYFPAARNLGTALYFTSFFFVWTAIVVFLWWKFHDVFFAILFSLVEVPLSVVWVNLWFRSSRVRIDAAKVRVTSHWLFIGPTKVFDPCDVAGFEAKAGMRSGQKQFYTLQLRISGGKKVTVASYVPGKQEAEWLCDELGRSLHRHK